MGEGWDPGAGRWGVPPALAGGVWRWVQNVTVPSSLAEGLGGSWMAVLGLRERSEVDPLS